MKCVVPETNLQVLPIMPLSNHPHLLLSLAADLLHPDLHAIITRDCLPTDRPILADQIFVCPPVLDDVGELLGECTAEKYIRVLSHVALHLETSQFGFRISNIFKLYHPSIPHFAYYVKISRMKPYMSNLGLEEFPEADPQELYEPRN